MIDFSTEQIISLSQAARDPMLGHSVHLSTVHRWRQRGIRGVRLETAMVGGRRMTSQEALVRFLHRVNAVEEEQTSQLSAPDQQRNSTSKEEDLLDHLGI